MGRTLLVAAGGGGDAITASALSRPLTMAERPVILTYSWDRLMIDPRPGPRRTADFSGLRELAPHIFQVLPSTMLSGPGMSSLPWLAAELPAELLLLDADEGAAGMATQVSAAVDYFSADEIVLIDVGGDVLTNGQDPGLRSPLADQLALAACAATGTPARVLIAAPGIDGEIPSETVLMRLRALGADQLPDLTPEDIAAVRHVFGWHPSEASGLVAAAASGHRGLVEVRDAGDQVDLSDMTTALFAVDAKAVLSVTPASHLLGSSSLSQAEAIIQEVTGISEIQYESDKAVRLQSWPTRRPTHADLPAADRHARAAGSRGAGYISTRRLSELLHASTLDAFTELCELLATERPEHYEPSIYRTSSQSGGWPR